MPPNKGQQGTRMPMPLQPSRGQDVRRETEGFSLKATGVNTDVDAVATKSLTRCQRPRATGWTYLQKGEVVVSDQMIGATFSAAGAAADRLNQVFAQKAQQEADAMFQHLAVEGEGNSSYNKSDYKRLAFDTQNEMVDFANAMGAQGINVNAAAVQVNGQWMAEIRQEHTDAVSNYSQEFGREVYEARDYDTSKKDKEFGEEQTSTASSFQSFMSSQLDDLGRALSGVQSFVEKYGENKDGVTPTFTGFRKGGELDAAVNQLNASPEAVAALKNDLGLNAPKGLVAGSVTRNDVLQLNEAFFAAAREKGLNVAFVDAKGNFNLEALKMPSVQKAFDKGTLELMSKVNAPNAWGGGTGVISGLAMRGAMKLSDDEDFQKMISGAQKGVKYTKQASTTVHQLNEARRNATAARKMRKSGVKKADKKTHIVKDKTPKTRKGISAEKNRLNEAKNKEKVNKLAEKLAKSEKGIFAKGYKMYHNLMTKIAENPLLKLVGKFNLAAKALMGKVIAIMLIAVAAMCGLVVAFAIVIFFVQALADFFNGLKAMLPSYYNQSVAYNLVQLLSEEEQKWIEGVEKFNTDLISDADEQMYGFNRHKLTSYLNDEGRKGEIQYIDGQFAINPFYKLLDEEDFDENCFGDYYERNRRTIDGERTYDYTANTSLYGNKYTAKDGTYVATESGHTSNIKDIICMVDTMYSGEMGEGDSVLSAIPAEWDAEAFWNGTDNIFVAIGNSIKNFFQSLKDSRPVAELNGKEGTDEKGNVITYRGIRQYSLYLFYTSHQTAIDLSVGYYSQTTDADGAVSLKVWDGQGYTEDSLNQYLAEKGITDTQPILGQLGICEHPLSYNHKIYYNSTAGHVAPYFADKNGVKYDLSTYDTGPINVTMDKAADKNDLCLRDDLQINDKSVFGSNRETWEYIVTSYDSTTGAVTGVRPCWSVSTAETSSTTYTRTGFSTKWCDSIDEAKKSALEDYLEKLATVTVPTDETYRLLSGWDGFMATRFVSVLEQIPNYFPFDKREVPDGFENGDPILGEDGEPTGEYKQVPKTKTQYKYKAEGIAYYTVNDKFVRDCQGHTFQYCAGHINVHTQGVVYSMTNEQLSIGGGYNSDDEKPLVSDYDWDKEYWGEDLIGKHDLTQIDKTKDVSTAANTENGFRPEQHPQGTLMGRRGLNFWVEGTDNLKDGVHFRDQFEYFMFRDIFDIDCAIDKGYKVLAWDKDWKEYDGWSADNMTLALSRATINWVENYGTDANIELAYKNSYLLTALDTTNDVNAIIEALQETYGDSLTEERKAAVTLALQWVGRGHYSEYHKEHGFLSKVCESNKTGRVDYSEVSETEIPEAVRDNLKPDGTVDITYNVSCTAGDDADFIKFLLSRVKELPESDVNTLCGGDLDNYLNTHNAWKRSNIPSGEADKLLPADILMHEDIKDFDYANLEFQKFPDDPDEFRDLIKSYTDERYVFVIGVIGKDVSIQNGSVTFPKGTLLTVDLQVYDNLGTIRLHSGNAETWDDIGLEADVYYTDDDGNRVDSGASNATQFKIGMNFKNYYWVTNPDERTHRWNPW